MESIFFLIPIALVLLMIAVAVFIWAIQKNQFSDLDKEAHRIIFDDQEERPAEKSNHAE